MLAQTKKNPIISAPSKYLFIEPKQKGTHMKYLLITALLASTTAFAEEAAKVQEPAEAEVTESGGFKDWPTLDDWANTNKLKSGTLSAEVLLGYEFSDLSDNGTKAASALLTRTRIKYQTANLEGFDALVQAQYVGPLNNHYAPRDPNYDTIADPEGFRLHQAYLAYTGFDTHARVGAQEIILDNARFIGNVGWRFNAQSFNAGLVKNNSIDNLTMLYAYADSINRIDGNTYNIRQYHLINGEYKLSENNRVSAFGYLQRNDASADIDTFGARFWGKNSTFVHDAMVAIQRKAYYGYLSAALDFEPADVEVGVEYLSGGDDPRERFQTLDGTAHGFNGWADQFLGTSAGLPAGLVDVWVKGTVSPMERMDLIGVYHYFNTAANIPAGSFSGTYGNEVDAMLKYEVCKSFDALTGVALYYKGDDAGTNFTADETVFWLRGTLRF